jgi:hypothetical protein
VKWPVEDLTGLQGKYDVDIIVIDHIDRVPSEN